MAIKGKQLATGADGVDTPNLKDGALSADAAGRAKIASSFFDVATVNDKIPSGAINLSRLTDTVVKANGTQAFTADQPLGGFRLTGLGAPSSANDAARKADVDAAAAGLTHKDTCRVATAAALPACTPAGSGSGKTLTADANGALSVDGISLAATDRVLVKDQAAGADNGIYDCTDPGDGSNPFILTRATDADDNIEVKANMYTFVAEGSANQDTGWNLITNDAITVDTTALSFAKFTGTGAITAGAGLTKAGDTLDVGAGTGMTINADDIEVIYEATGGNLSVIDAGDAAAVGSLDTAARGDHQHAVSTAAPGAMTPGASASEGASTSLARADHAHSVAVGAPVGLADANAAGSGNAFSRDDHAHKRDVVRQESVATQTITGTDTAMTDTLDATPLADAQVKVYLNGVLQKQGAGADYTVSGDTITWLASSGSAVDQETSDEMLAVYSSAA